MEFNLFNTSYSPIYSKVVDDIFLSNNISTGEYVDKFQSGLSGILNLKNLIALRDLSSSVHLSLHLAGVKEGDKVLVPALNCLSSTSAIANLGAIPIWVDYNPDTLEIDYADLEKKAGDAKVFICYYFSGYPSDINKIKEICENNSLLLIEDCNNAIGTMVYDSNVGTYGDMSVFSFYPNRIINTIDGGGISINNEAISFYQARRLTRYGIEQSGFRDEIGEISISHDVKDIGWSSSMSNLSAAIGCSQLSLLKDKINKNHQNGMYIKNLFEQGESNIIPIRWHDSSIPSFWTYLIRVRNKREFIEKAKGLGIYVSSLHTRNDRYSGFLYGQKYNLPGTETLERELVAIPIGWWLSFSEIRIIYDTIVMVAKEADENVQR